MGKQETPLERLKIATGDDIQEPHRTYMKQLFTKRPKRIATCLFCEKEFEWTPYTHSSRKGGPKFCGRPCYRADRQKDMDKTAYPMLWVDGRRVYLHRYIYEQHHGVKLRSDQIIHHKDENPFNRAIENLELIDGEEALREHLMKHKW